MTVNNSSKKAKLHQLKQGLELQEALNRISQSEDYQEYLLPILLSAVKNKWLDPSGFKTYEEFHLAYSAAFGRAKAYGEIINMLAGSEAGANRITKAMDPEPKYEI